MIDFISGTIGCGKSLELHSTYWKNKTINKTIALIKSVVDTRNGSFIHTRHGNQSLPCGLWKEGDSLIDLLNSLDKDIKYFEYDLILIDEAQFLTLNQIKEIENYSNYTKGKGRRVEIKLYGLLNDFKGNMFPASKKIFEIKDNFTELQSKCWCGEDAKQNAKILNNKVITEGDSINIGYGFVPLCNLHFKTKRLK